MLGDFKNKGNSCNENVDCFFFMELGDYGDWRNIMILHSVNWKKCEIHAEKAQMSEEEILEDKKWHDIRTEIEAQL